MTDTDRLRTAYERYSKGDYGLVDDFFAEDIVWHITGLDDLTGRDQVRAFFEGLGEQFSGHTITLDDAVEAPGRVVAFVHHTLTRDGEEGIVQAVHDWRFADGQATSLREVADTMAFAVISGQISIPA